MAEVAKRFQRAGLFLLLLAGPILGFASKGFAPLMAVAGAFALIGLMLDPQKLKSIDLRPYWPVAPFLIFALLSILWSSATNPLRSYGVLISVLIFTFGLWQAFNLQPDTQKISYRKYLAASTLFGVMASIIVGSYPEFFPQLERILRDASNRTEFGNIELLRQGNRSLSLMPVFLLLTAGFFWQNHKLSCLAVGVAALYVTTISHSQTALLGMIVGLGSVCFFYLVRKNGKRIAFLLFATGLVISPVAFEQSFEKDWVKNYVPEFVQKKASGQLREYYYFVYAKESGLKPLFGHGFEASQQFSPDGLDAYKSRNKTNNLRIRRMTAFPHAHNFPLQIIFEFGYVGAALFLFAIWRALNFKLSANKAPVIGGALGATIALIMFAYSIWQSWLLASLGFILFYMLVLYYDDGKTAEEAGATKQNQA